MQAPTSICCHVHSGRHGLLIRACSNLLSGAAACEALCPTVVWSVVLLPAKLILELYKQARPSDYPTPAHHLQGHLASCSSHHGSDFTLT